MILIDTDTQIDFMLPAGALYVPGAEGLIPVLARILEQAGRRGIPILSSTDAHAENDPEFSGWPPHCVAGTTGQQKIPQTLLKNRAVVPNRPGLELPAGAAQFIVEKQTLDVFSNPNFRWLLDRYPEEECAVLGVATDYCVRHSVEGLLRARRRIAIVTDGICGIGQGASEELLKHWQAKGARLAKSEDLWT